MKKALILAYDFPPYISAGGLRPYSWYRYMHEFGIYPVVITRQWDNKFGNHLDYVATGSSTQTIIEKNDRGTIIKTPYTPNLSNRLLLKYGHSRFKFIRKLITGYYDFAQFFLSIGPKVQLYFEAIKYLKTNKVECIIASGDPFVLFNYASKLSKKFNVPWIADYRDPWSHDVLRQKNYLVKMRNIYLENKIVNTAHAITTVSKFIKFQISSLIKDKSIFVIPNGYNPETIASIKGIKQQNEVLTISFVGTIYNWHPIRSFLAVFAQFLRNNEEAKIQLAFYGITLEHELNELIASDFSTLKHVVSIYPKRDNHATLKEMASSNLMLLFNDYLYLGTKIYDYIGLNRSILFCYTDDEEAQLLKDKYYLVEEIDGKGKQLQQDFITETSSGYLVKDAEHLSKLLGDLYREFLENGYIQCNSRNTANYSRKYQTGKLAEIINNT